MSELQKKKTIIIRGDSFTLDITDFKVGDLIAIEAEKQRLSKSTYYEMATTWFKNTVNAANLIDMISTLRVLLPEVEKSLEGIPFEKLNIIDSRELLKIYVKEISPWYMSWMEEFNSPFEDDEVVDEVK
jgi:hypothetical protein